MTNHTDHWLTTPTPAEVRLAGKYTARGKRAWQPSRARDRAMRELVFTRDDHTCKGCGRGSWLELDHIVPYKLGGYFIASNLQTLCMWCNASKGARTA